MRELFLGNRRFDQIQENVCASRPTISARLARLIEAEVVSKDLYQQNPPRYEYRPTNMGKELFPILMAINGWGDKWLAKGGRPRRLLHTPCDSEFKPSVVCGCCGKELTLQDVKQL